MSLYEFVTVMVSMILALCLGHVLRSASFLAKTERDVMTACDPRQTFSLLDKIVVCVPCCLSGYTALRSFLRRIGMSQSVICSERE